MKASLKMQWKRWILSFKPVQFFIERILPKIRFTTWYAELPEGTFGQFCRYARPGDIVFSCDTNKLAGMLIPGEWDHVGIVVDTLDGLMIVEAVQPRVRKSDFFTFCAHSNKIAIARPVLSAADLLRFQITALGFVGISYDALFVIGREALYCSEVVLESYPYLSDTGKPSNILGVNMRDDVGLGTSYATPDAIWNATGLRKIWTSGDGNREAVEAKIDAIEKEILAGPAPDTVLKIMEMCRLQRLQEYDSNLA